MAAAPLPSNGIIATSGSYYLPGNRTGAGTYNIQIQADDVDLDLNDKIVQYSGENTTTTTAVIAALGRINVTIRNGRIIGGKFGVYANGTNYLTVQDVDFTGSRYIGVAVSATSVGLKVQRCIFAKIAGFTAEAYVVGVNGVGVNGLVELCEFRELYRQAGAPQSLTGEACGVLVSSGATNAVIRNNWFENAELRGERDIAVWVATGASATIAENSITNFGRGIIMPGSGTVADNRLLMRGAEAGSNGIHLVSGAVADNLVVGYETPISGSPECSGNTIIS
jgi:hypothetical protein